ncbi:O-acyltransferase like protein [Aplysia californica]|uniref:O-acyltransferase like protein n=1 Tax=Aplysia californica TaxID=6500 RepID=A0ABM1W1E9_APLCA|nr:O-acyltransferase like protein [Aplysia californica]
MSCAGVTPLLSALISLLSFLPGAQSGPYNDLIVDVYTDLHDFQPYQNYLQNVTYEEQIGSSLSMRGRIEELIWDKSRNRYREILDVLRRASEKPHFVTPPEPSLSHTCAHELYEWMRALGREKNWALRMLDSWGRPGSAIMQGNIQYFGEFTGCLRIETTEEDLEGAQIDGQYCLLNIKVSLSRDIYNFQSYIPNSKDSFKVEVKCHRDVYMESGTLIGITLLYSSLLVIVVLATFADFTLDRQGEERKSGDDTKEDGLAENDGIEAKINDISGSTSSKDEYLPLLKTMLKTKRDRPLVKILLCFSAKTNMKDLLDMSSPKDKDKLDCLNGMRVFTMFWIVFGHAILLSITTSQNPIQFFRDQGKSLWFQVMNVGTLSCDTFLLIGGLVLTYGKLNSWAKKGRKISWWKYYVNRYLRLTPLMFLVYLFAELTNPYWFTGPVTRRPEEYFPRCKDTWWQSLLYINNFNHGCYEWTWYLSVDMQIFIVTPIFLLAFDRKPVIAYVLCGLASAFSMSWTAYTSHERHVALTPMDKVEHYPPLSGDDFLEVYAVTWFRLTPYMVGMLIGYLLHRTNMTINMSKIVLLLGWMTVLAVSATLIFLPMNAHAFLTDCKPLTLTQAVLISTLSRPLWSLCVAWVVVVCATKNAAPINSFLSLGIFSIGTKLSYAMYLIHLFLISALVRSIHHVAFISLPNVFVLTNGVLLITAILSTVAHLLIEKPLSNLQDLYLK